MSVFRIALTVVVVVLGLLWKRHKNFQSRSKGLPLPPGPAPLPLVGNLFDMPQLYPWKRFLEWTDTYGDLVYIEALGNGVMVLNSMEAVNDLLVKRAAIYSNRPTLVMLGELMDIQNSSPLLQYGPALRQHRKLYHHAMGPDKVTTYIRAQEDAAALFVDALLHRPKDFWEETRLAAGRIIMNAVYGIPASTPVDVFLKDANEMMHITGKAIAPGAHLVDMIPALKYLPSWLPFNNIHEHGRKGRELAQSTISKPYEYVQQQIKQGIGRPSCTIEFIRAYESETGKLDAEAETFIKWSSGSLHAPGSETTYAATLVFIHAMALYPDVQAKIQAEIDDVVGHHRLPAVSDRSRLPYVCATIKEVLRWKPVAPMSVPRRASKDDYYKGYFIPAETMLMSNAWAISRDKISGISPDIFAPERFMADLDCNNAIDPYLYVFGSGRRECPGRYLADNSLFLIISWMMATVTISKPKNAEGVEELKEPAYVSNLISYPEPFEVDFRKRNEDIAALIKHRISEIE